MLIKMADGSKNNHNKIIITKMRPLDIATTTIIAQSTVVITIIIAMILAEMRIMIVGD